MKSYQYSDNEEEQHIVAAMNGCDDQSNMVSVVGEAPLRNNGKWMRTTGLIAFATCLFIAFFAKSNNNRSEAFPVASTQLVDIEGSSMPSSVTACTFEECYASNCNWKVAPYTCLFMNGGPHGGCSPTPWFVPATCTTQCDLSKCGDSKIPKEAESCEDTPCDPTWCKNTGERLCGPKAPYQCTEGSSAFGCSDDEFVWTFKSSPTTCSTCCNAAKCT